MKLAAVVQNGHIYTSANGGQDWIDRSTGSNGLPASNLLWQGIASSTDGMKLAAVIFDGKVYTSDTAGASWKMSLDATTTFSDFKFASIASSATGETLIAVKDHTRNNFVFVSLDSGATWKSYPISVSAASAPMPSVAASANGEKVAAVVLGQYIYTSTDSGKTWKERPTEVGAKGMKWLGIASSVDGTRLVAVVNGGHVYTSSDSGATWIDRSSGAATGNLNWQSIASSSKDGTKFVAAVYGGHIYTLEITY